MKMPGYEAADAKCGTGILPVVPRSSAGSRCHRPAFALSLTLALLLSSCATKDTAHHIVISARDQKLAVLENGRLIATYPVSTSKYGLGDARGSYRTPLGEMEIATKIGDGAAPGAVFKNRRRTGEVVRPDSPGRDPIVTRIIWLRGRERQNSNAFARDIYIHGTPEERNIGRPASYGCVRMRSVDVVHLYELVGPGAQVTITDQPLAALVPAQTQTSSALVQLNRGAKNYR
jgi:lipoprotein-anchoring transpeptidase ErfK/SrfK